MFQGDHRQEEKMAGFMRVMTIAMMLADNAMAIMTQEWCEKGSEIQYFKSDRRGS